MTAKELEKIIALCKSQGVAKVKTQDFEIELSAHALKPVIVDDGKEPETEKQYSNEDVLFWSVGGEFGEANT